VTSAAKLQRFGATAGAWRETIAIVLVGGAVYLATDLGRSAGRPDFYYLADAFLHGRLWLETPLFPIDSVVVGDRTYIPFGPLMSIVLVPLVAMLGPAGASAHEPVVNALMAAGSLALVDVLLHRVARLTTTQRFWIVVFFGFSTPLWWLVLNGGVWHEAQILATVITLAFLVEAFGRRRPLLLGALVGAAFLCRPPVILALPFAAWMVARDADDLGDRLKRIAAVAIAAAPALAIALWYNAARFGSPFESGYGLAAIPDFLAAQRAQGLFSLAHVPMNLDYLLWHLPRFRLAPAFIVPDGFGMSIALTSPALILAVRADWRSRETLLLAGTCLLVLIPSLLYYGGGWFQFGYRYALDVLPFTIAMLARAVERSGLPRWGIALIVFGCAVNGAGILWAHFG
jgi:hypothetical protein